MSVDGKPVRAMSGALYIDPSFDDPERRERLYAGEIMSYSARSAVAAFAAFARGMIEREFAPSDARTAQHSMPVERFAEHLNRLKPSFIHHEESKRHVRAILTELGCDPDKTYFDVPRLRSSTSDGYLTTGIAYAWHPHRDTWYSAPACQINWWLPVYEITAENAMAFHPQYFSRAVSNNSADYNYYEWNRVHRGAHVASYTKGDPRPLPRPTETVEVEPQIRVLLPVGGVMAFSGAQMHSSVPNTSGVTRYSIDFRTVHVDDARARRGAKNVDSACTGTTMRDYLRVSDLAHIPEEVISLHDDDTGNRGVLAYSPAT
jgi:hypothetical protein